VGGPASRAHFESDFEKRLIARFQAGDAEALGTLFEMHIDRVFAFTRHMLGNREDAEEVTSQTFLRAFQRAASYRGECPFRGWLFGIARNLCYDLVRQPRLLTLEPDEAQSTDAGRFADRMATSALVQAALQGLSEEHRLVLLLCDVEEWDAREVAAILERSVPATKSLLYRARRALRDELTAAAEQEDGDHAVR
jgi:RNA polymerase sigma-70 factor (ECF subfamily)